MSLRCSSVTTWYVWFDKRMFSAVILVILLSVGTRLPPKHTKPGCFGSHSGTPKVYTRMPNRVGLVMLGCLPGYLQSTSPTNHTSSPCVEYRNLNIFVLPTTCMCGKSTFISQDSIPPYGTWRYVYSCASLRLATLIPTANLTKLPPN